MNGRERTTFAQVEGIAAKYGARLFTKARLADVLSVKRNEVSRDLFSYALMAHLDCMVTDALFVPLFAVEYDGPSHATDAKTQQRDLRKQALCERFGLPLARVRDEHLFKEARGIGYLPWLTELFFTARWLSEARDKGQIPEDEPIDPMLLLSDPSIAEGHFPLFVSRIARVRLQGLQQKGVLRSPMPMTISGRDALGASHCLAVIDAPGGRLLCSRASIFLRGFGVPGSEVAEELAVVDLERQAQAGRGGGSPAAARAAVIRTLSSLKSEVNVQGYMGVELGFLLEWEPGAVRVGALDQEPERMFRFRD